MTRLVSAFLLIILSFLALCLEAAERHIEARSALLAAAVLDADMEIAVVRISAGPSQSVDLHALQATIDSLESLGSQVNFAAIKRIVDAKEANGRDAVMATRLASVTRSLRLTEPFSWPNTPLIHFVSRTGGVGSELEIPLLLVDGLGPLGGHEFQGWDEDGLPPLPGFTVEGKGENTVLVMHPVKTGERSVSLPIGDRSLRVGAGDHDHVVVVRRPARWADRRLLGALQIFDRHGVAGGWQIAELLSVHYEEQTNLSHYSLAMDFPWLHDLTLDARLEAKGNIIVDHYYYADIERQFEVKFTEVFGRPPAEDIDQRESDLQQLIAHYKKKWNPDALIRDLERLRAVADEPDERAQVSDTLETEIGSQALRILERAEWNMHKLAQASQTDGLPWWPEPAYLLRQGPWKPMP